MDKTQFVKFLAASVSASALLLSGCASTPKENAQVGQLEQKIKSLEPLPGEPQYAPVAVEEAREALEKLRSLEGKSGKREAYEHQLYLTGKQIEIAEELVAIEKSEKVVGGAEVRRKDILLEAKTQEVEDKTQEVEQAKNLAAGIAMRAQELAEQVEDLQTQETERGLVLTLGSVLFETGKATLRSGAQRTVEKVASFLNEYPDRSIMIEGFTDSQGSETYNRELSEQRAQTVRDLLTNYGVENGRINTEGYGEEFPVADNNTAEGRQQNRRVEIVIAKTAGTDISDRTSMR